MNGTNRTRPSQSLKRPAVESALRSVCPPTPVGVPVLRFVHTNPCTNVAATLGPASLPSRPRSACLGLDGPLDGQYLCCIGTRDCLKPRYGKYDAWLVSFRHELNGGCDDLVDGSFIAVGVGEALGAESAGDVHPGSLGDRFQVGIGDGGPGYAAVPGGFDDVAGLRIGECVVGGEGEAHHGAVGDLLLADVSNESAKLNAIEKIHYLNSLISIRGRFLRQS